MCSKHIILVIMFSRETGLQASTSFSFDSKSRHHISLWSFSLDFDSIYRKRQTVFFSLIKCFLCCDGISLDVKQLVSSTTTVSGYFR